MTTDKQLKRAAHELAATEGISYTAALRLLTKRTGETYTLGQAYAVLEKHSIYCVDCALQEATALGIDEDDAAKQVAAQRLKDNDMCCCLSKPGQPLLAASYRVPVRFQESPTKAGRYADLADFAWQLFDLLGMYSAIDIRWSPRYIDGSGVVQLDEATYLIAVLLPDEVACAELSGTAALQDHVTQAASAVARALHGLGYDESTVAIDYDGIRAIPAFETRIR